MKPASSKMEYLLATAVALLLAASGCKRDEGGHDHSVAHPPGHDHHEEGHGHADEEMVLFTLFSDKFEAFGEHPKAVAGQSLEILLHLTILDGFRPLNEGSVQLQLEGPETLTSAPATAVRPGIYRLVLTVPEPGQYQGKIQIDGKFHDTIAGLELVVHASGQATSHGHTDDAHHDEPHGEEPHDHKPHGEEPHDHKPHGDEPHDHKPHGDTPNTHEPHGDEPHTHEPHDHKPHDDEAKAAPAATPHDALVEFLKEQQWGVPFGTAFARNGVLSENIQVTGTVGTPPNGMALVSAPVSGQLLAPPGGFVRPGATVKKGQLLAALAPTPGSPEQASQAQLALAEAQARVNKAELALQRATRLFADQAISQRAVEDAEREAALAEDALKAAQRAAAIYSGARSGQPSASWRLVAPMQGTIVAVNATAGATVSPGQALFTLLDAEELWLSARVPEADAARLELERDASFSLPGQDDWIPIVVGGEAATGTVVSVGRTVDPVSRTVDVIYSLKHPDKRLRVGGLVRIQLPVGGLHHGIVVPQSALLDQQGRYLIYVQVDGEHFEERTVSLGPRAGGRVAITDGLRDGERIVTKGAHLVRLADASKNTQPHGHVH